MVGPAGGRRGPTRNVRTSTNLLLPTTGAANASVFERRRYPDACGAHDRRYACGPNETPNFPRIQHVGLNLAVPEAVKRRTSRLQNGTSTTGMSILPETSCSTVHTWIIGQWER